MKTQRQIDGEICMAEMKKDINFIKEEMTELKETMKEFIQSAPSKFADKKTEERVIALEKDSLAGKIWMAYIAGGAVVLWFIIQALLKHYNIL